MNIQTIEAKSSRPHKAVVNESQILFTNTFRKLIVRVVQMPEGDLLFNYRGLIRAKIDGVQGEVAIFEAYGDDDELLFDALHKMVMSITTIAGTHLSQTELDLLFELDMKYCLVQRSK